MFSVKAAKSKGEKLIFYFVFKVKIIYCKELFTNLVAPDFNIDVNAGFDFEAGDFLHSSGRALNVDDSGVNFHRKFAPCVRALSARRFSCSNGQRFVGHIPRSAHFETFFFGGVNYFIRDKLQIFSFLTAQYYSYRRDFFVCVSFFVLLV